MIDGIEYINHNISQAEGAEDVVVVALAALPADSLPVDLVADLGHWLVGSFDLAAAAEVEVALDALVVDDSGSVLVDLLDLASVRLGRSSGDA